MPKQRSHPGEFAPESMFFIRTECNSCPRAITIGASCPRRALSVTGEPKLDSCTCIMLKQATLQWSVILSCWLFGISAQLSSGYSFQKGYHFSEVPNGSAYFQKHQGTKGQNTDSASI